ncbi:MAG: hydrogenase maturation nickel metallochaperone HypA [Eubacterium sp.]
MHELGIVYQIVRTVDEIKREQFLSEIESITLEIGEMSDVVPKFISEAWQAVRETTDYPNAEMKIDIISAKARCKQCGYEELIRKIDFECPKCKSSEFEIISGREFIIKEIIAK